MTEGKENPERNRFETISLRLKTISDENIKLQSRCRWLRIGLLISFVWPLIVGCVVYAMTRPVSAKAEIPDRLEAGEFILRDRQGYARATLQMTETGQPRMIFGGNEKATLTVGFQDAREDFPYMSINDGDGKKRLSMFVAREGPELNLYDEKENPAASLGHHTGSGPLFSLGRWPSRTSIRASVLADDLFGINMFDKDGNTVIQIPWRP